MPNDLSANFPYAQVFFFSIHKLLWINYTFSSILLIWKKFFWHNNLPHCFQITKRLSRARISFQTFFSIHQNTLHLYSKPPQNLPTSPCTSFIHCMLEYLRNLHFCISHNLIYDIWNCTLLFARFITPAINLSYVRSALYTDYKDCAFCVYSKGKQECRKRSKVNEKV
jgi:hypothetical protein